MSGAPATRDDAVEIAGAGLAGLSAALMVARHGGRARVYERNEDVGGRFHGDFQGLENWSASLDVLEELAQLGIEPEFPYTPFREVVCFGPSGREYTFRSQRPLFYLVRRGSEPGTLDQALKAQALRAGVEIRFGQRARHLPHGGLAAEGPHRADAVAAGYVFPTALPDGAYAAVSDRLAPKGYAYLLICRGRATLASCLFADFHNERRYVERTAAFFHERVGIEVRDGVRFGGAGNFGLPRRSRLRRNGILFAGETAGFQDALFGFGMRYALRSGAAAGRALVQGRTADYERGTARGLRALMGASIVNRMLYDRLGDRGYEAVLRRYPANYDVARWLGRAYAPRWWKRALAPWLARRRFSTVAQAHADCDCTWCRCQREPVVAGSTGEKR